MKLFIYLVMTILFIYTTGFAITIWKEKNKSGAIAVFVLALIIVISPFFTILK